MKKKPKRFRSSARDGDFMEFKLKSFREEDVIRTLQRIPITESDDFVFINWKNTVSRNEWILGKTSNVPTFGVNANE